jgi:hypothetical protein
MWPRDETPLSRGLAAAIAPGFGIGFSSIVYFGLFLVTSQRNTLALLDAGVWLAVDICLLFAVMRRKRSNVGPGPAESAPAVGWKPAFLVMSLGFLALLAFAVASSWLGWARFPHGQWDAWSIWNLRARSIFRGAPDWPALFSPAIAWSNLDYPLLVPLTVARVWAYEGRESTAVPATVAMLFFLASVAATMVGVGRLRGWVAGLLSGMTLLVARMYVVQGSCQCADIPLGFFLLVAMSFAAMSREAKDPAPFLVAAGAAAGMAAWTKNEGIVLLALIALVSVFSARRLQALTWTLSGAALPVIALAVFKAFLAPPNYLFKQNSGALIEKLVDAPRWMIVTRGVIDRIPTWGDVPGGALLWLILAVALTARLDRASVGRATFGVLLLMGMSVGYSLVYVATPLPLEWSIATSFDRLFTQLWPALVWSAFQLSGSPASSVRMHDQKPVASPTARIMPSLLV